MLTLNSSLLFAPPLASSFGYDVLGMVGMVIAAVICPAIPLTTGIARGQVTLGIIGALVTLAVVGLTMAFPKMLLGGVFGCAAGLPVGCGLAALISIIPKVDGPLLSQSEIEAETRRLRGY